MAGEIQAAFDAVYVDGPSTSPAHPDKVLIRDVVGATIQSQMDSTRDLATNGAQPKDAVRAASLTNVTMASVVNGASFGGVTVATGDRVSFIGQSAGATNGIYVVQASAAPVRATDADASDEVFRMAFYVKEGTLAGKSYICTNATAPTLGTTALVFALSSDTSSLNATLTAVDQKADAAFHKDLAIKAFEEATFDSSGNFVSGSDVNGAEYSAQAGSVVLTEPGTPKGLTAYTWAVAQFASIPTIALSGEIDYGILDIDQSHFGLSHDAGDATITTTAQHPGYGLMPSTNVFTRLNDAVSNYAAYIDLREVEIPGAGGSYETICSGTVDAILRRCQAAFGAKPRIIMSGSIRGGTPYKMLRRGSPWYQDVLRVARANVAISGKSGRRYEVLALATNHGQQDWLDGIGREEYIRFLTEWQQDLDHDLRKITGQTRPIRLYFNQSGYRSSMNIGEPNEPAIAQFMAPKRNPMLRFAGATYQSLGSTDDSGGHYKASGFYQNGLLLGAAIFDGEFGYNQRSLECIDWWWTSTTTIRLKYNMPIALETDDTVIKISDLGAGKGVDFIDGTGSPPTVTGIAVASSVYLDVTLSAAPTGRKCRLYIAARATNGGAGQGGTGSQTGNRSAIRAATSYDTAPLTGAVLYQRAPMQELIL